MHSVVGIFSDRDAAQWAADALDLPADRVSVVAPRPMEAEDTGIGSVLGGAVGGAIGAAAGSTLATVAASMLVPGVGPVLVTGVIGALILGAGGVAAGASVGGRVEEAAGTDPAHNPTDLFYYHEALRHGRAIVLSLADSPGEAAAIRARLASGGARALDTFREDWWQQFRQSETDFARDEDDYRRGFETAFEADNRGKPLAEGADATDAYRQGYRRGYEYYRKFY
jgi:hypothetical protein